MIGERTPRRIALVGCGGSGKTTRARELGERLALPVFHLDGIFWQRGWQAMERATFVAEQERIMAGEAWVVDGNYGGTMRAGVGRADLVIFLDFPTWTCLSGIFRRWWTYRGQVPPGQSSGNPERLTLEFVLWALTYRRQRRRRVLQMLEDHAAEFVALADRSEIPQLIERLAAR